MLIHGNVVIMNTKQLAPQNQNYWVTFLKINQKENPKF